MTSTDKRQQKLRKRMRADGYTQTTIWELGIYCAEQPAFVKKLKRERGVK